MRQSSGALFTTSFILQNHLLCRKRDARDALLASGANAIKTRASDLRRCYGSVGGIENGAAFIEVRAVDLESRLQGEVFLRDIVKDNQFVTGHPDGSNRFLRVGPDSIKTCGGAARKSHGLVRQITDYVILIRVRPADLA